MLSVRQLREIWENPGRDPAYHIRRKERLRNEWPMLYWWVVGSLAPPRPANKIVRHSDGDMEMAKYLLQKVQANLPFVKTPSEAVMDQWADSIRKLRQIDGYSYDLIEAVINWAVEDPFWQANIRSAPTLRKQFETLLAQIKRDQGGRSVI